MTARPLCATLLPQVGDLWFSTDATERRQAKRTCSYCPLLHTCREEALADPDLRGVWGGLTSGERAHLRGAPAGGPDPDDEASPDECGTDSAYRAHRMRGEACARCEAVHDEQVRESRLARLARVHERGGSDAGGAIHRKLGEPLCEMCRRASAQDQAARKARRTRERLRGVPATQETPGRTRGAQTAAEAAA